MVLSTLSAKNQTTVNAELVRSFNLKPGSRFRQYGEGNRIILEPVPSILDSYGVFYTGEPALSIAEEDDAMERAVADEVMGIERAE